MYFYFLKRELSDKFIGNSSVIFWLLFQPLATMAVFYFVFGTIFQSRIPELPQQQFVAYLAAGLWMWMAFSETVLSASQLILNKSQLISKVKVDLRLMIMAHISASFGLQILGLLVVVITLLLTGIVSPQWKLLLLLFPILLLFLITVVISFFFAMLQVFHRDTHKILQAFIPLWFFLTPIIYAIDRAPEYLKAWMTYNPIFTVVDFSHKSLLPLGEVNWMAYFVTTMVFSLLLLLVLSIFNKTSPFFDDYL